MAKTDPEADVSEHTSENEDVEEVQSEGGGLRMTLEQRRQKLAQLRSRMVRFDTVSVAFGLAYEQATALFCPGEQDIFNRRKHESKGVSKRCDAIGAPTKAC